MESNNGIGIPPQTDAPPPADAADWRTQLLPQTRQRIVDKITEIMKRHLPFSGSEGMQEHKEIAIRFEEKTYGVATSQSDYLRKIALKMLTMESKSQNSPNNALPSNSAADMTRNPQDSAKKMESDNGIPPQTDAPPADCADWRTQLLPESRQRIVNKITEILKRHLPFSGSEGLQELEEIAIRFEEKTYGVSASQSDYLRKIALKMLTMESKSQNSLNNALPSNSAADMTRNPQDSEVDDATRPCSHRSFS